jgi:hypothetical protein
MANQSANSAEKGRAQREERRITLSRYPGPRGGQCSAMQTLSWLGVSHTVNREDMIMIKPTTLRQLAIGVSLPTFAVSPAVAKATIYMPSRVAARMLGGTAFERVVPMRVDESADMQSAERLKAG